jgi:hypothetical protein
VPLQEVSAGLWPAITRRCRVLSHPHSFGYGGSLRPCIAWCSRPRDSATFPEGALGCERQAQLRQAEPLEHTLHLDRDRLELLHGPDMRVALGLQLLQPTLEHLVA